MKHNINNKQHNTKQRQIVYILLFLCVLVFFCFFYINVFIVFFFFFQAEDGIRDHCVTGVQTCALPIWSVRQAARNQKKMPAPSNPEPRSEERRVGKSVDLGGRRIIKKKKKKKKNKTQTAKKKKNIIQKKKKNQKTN